MTYTAGKDYEVIESLWPASATVDNIPVIEFFSYADSRCKEFDAELDAWRRKQQIPMLLERIPVVSDINLVRQSRMFYALTILGVEEDLREKIYESIKLEKNHLLTPQTQANFVAEQGVDRQKFLSAYSFPSVTEQTKRAATRAESYVIHNVPTVIVRGRYKTGPAYSDGIESTIKVLEYLATQAS